MPDWPFSDSFIYSIPQIYIWGTDSVPDIVLGTGNVVVNKSKKKKNLCHPGAYILVRETAINKTNR